MLGTGPLREPFGRSRTLTTGDIRSIRFFAQCGAQRVENGTDAVTLFAGLHHALLLK